MRLVQVGVAVVPALDGRTKGWGKVRGRERGSGTGGRILYSRRVLIHNRRSNLNPVGPRVVVVVATDDDTGGGG